MAATGGRDKVASAAEERGIGPVRSIHRRPGAIGDGAVKWVLFAAGVGCVGMVLMPHVSGG